MFDGMETQCARPMTDCLAKCLEYQPPGRCKSQMLHTPTSLLWHTMWRTLMHTC